MSEIKIPGKVILSGEYAVLFSGTAVALPVPRYLYVHPAAQHPAQGYPPAAEAGFSAYVPELKRLEAKPPVIPPCEFDARELRGTGSDGAEIKLGLGSSAAEAVGALAWRYESCGLDWREHRLEIAGHALSAHLSLQHGLGSGIDVMVSAYGEALLLQLIAAKRSIRQIQPVTYCKFPPLALVHSGLAANTRQLVGRFLDWRYHAGKPGEQMIAAMCTAADELATEWSSGNGPALYAALDAFDAKLRLCLDAAGVGYMQPKHHFLAEWARHHGGRAKPTGAGGGDMALLIGELPYHELDDEVMRLACCAEPEGYQ